MTTPPFNSPPPTSDAGAAAEKTLRSFPRCFFAAAARADCKKETAPGSIGQKLFLTLCFYALFGCVALFFVGQPVFALSVYLHAMTFVFLGLFVASSAGEILFNDEEADILLHRPVSPQAFLRAKVSVLVKVSLWLAFAFNLAGFFAGLSASDGDWRFPVAHVVSTCLEALFCTGFVVMIYQLCLRWFGRERLDGLMTGAQVLVSVAAVLSGQILPRFVLSGQHIVNFNARSWWIALLPPAWFAGIDDALAGSMAAGSWQLAAMAVVATTIVVFLAFGKLAHDYATGLQRIGEVVSTRAHTGPADAGAGSTGSPTSHSCEFGCATQSTRVVSARRRLPGSRPRRKTSPLSRDGADPDLAHRSSVRHPRNRPRRRRGRKRFLESSPPDFILA